jgi:ribonuclease HII
VGALQPSPDHLLIDAFKLPTLKLPQRNIIHGDRLSAAIAAASVVAKVYRDRLMREYDVIYPGYGFAAHKGYGTAAHQAALAELGATPLHRRCFAPIAAIGNSLAHNGEKQGGSNARSRRAGQGKGVDGSDSLSHRAGREDGGNHDEA